MIWYWCIVVIKKIVWFFRVPKPEELARADRNDRCPSCGWRRGRMRTVWKQRPGPKADGAPPQYDVFRQHTCLECGARRFLKPLDGNASMDNIWPAIPRDELEAKEDRYHLPSEVN